MAFYNNPYQPNYQQGFPATYQPVQQMPMQQAQPQIQTGGFVSAPNEDYARNYPIAPGNTMYFRDEVQPYIYTKTMGFNSMEPPVFKKFRMIEENAMAEVKAEAQPEAKTDYATKTELEELRSAYAKLQDNFEVLRKSITLFTDKEEQNE